MSFLDQQPSHPASSSAKEPLRLTHPTPFHVQQSLLRQEKEKIEEEDDTFSSVDLTMHSLSQFHNYPLNDSSISGNGVGDGFAGVDPSLMSPLSATPIGSPSISHMETTSPYGRSPVNNTLYSPTAGGADLGGDLAMDPSHFGGMTFTRSLRRPTMASTAGGEIVGSPPMFHSMSMPSHGPGGGWLGGSSFQEHDAFPGSHPSSFELRSGGAAMLANMGDSDDPENQKQAQIVFEKRRRRRESHNAVERRRRDNINEKIQELSSLLPENFLDGKPNKGIILKKSVDYIKTLQMQLQKQAARNRELEAMMRQYQNNFSINDRNPNSEDGWGAGASGS
ncbi:uncharacterized protein VTP21DRAFT_4136 [Calcarisporiella thermophila]|uniref:uncharacterized protein n=1 Tax=Calcarisporiella thermophila TaxID=911321 RepID=UPI0037442CED